MYPSPMSAGVDLAIDWMPQTTPSANAPLLPSLAATIAWHPKYSPWHHRRLLLHNMACWDYSPLLEWCSCVYQLCWNCSCPISNPTLIMCDRLQWQSRVDVGSIQHFEVVVERASWCLLRMWKTHPWLVRSMWTLYKPTRTAIRDVALTWHSPLCIDARYILLASIEMICWLCSFGFHSTLSQSIRIQLPDSCNRHTYFLMPSCSSVTSEVSSWRWSLPPSSFVIAGFFHNVAFL